MFTLSKCLSKCFIRSYRWPSQTSNTVAVQLSADESVWRYLRDPFPELPQHKLPGALDSGHKHMWSSTSWTWVRTDGVLSCKTNGSNNCPKSLCIVSCDPFAQTLDQGGRFAVEDVTQDSGMLALRKCATHGFSRASKLFRVLFACYALSNFVILARPSDPIFLGTLVTGTVSTLCSFVQLTSGLDGDRKDLDFIITNKRYVPYPAASAGCCVWSFGNDLHTIL